MKNYTHPVVGRETPYEDACKHLGNAPLTIEHMNIYPENQRQYMLSKHRIVTVLDVVKEGDDEMDYNDDDQWKYCPLWDMETYGDAPAGSGFSLYGVGSGRTLTYCGSRLVFASEEKAKHVANIMNMPYRKWIKK